MVHVFARLWNRCIEKTLTSSVLFLWCYSNQSVFNTVNKTLNCILCWSPLLIWLCQLNVYENNNFTWNDSRNDSNHMITQYDPHDLLFCTLLQVNFYIIRFLGGTWSFSLIKSNVWRQSWKCTFEIQV